MITTLTGRNGSFHQGKVSKTPSDKCFGYFVSGHYSHTTPEHNYSRGSWKWRFLEVGKCLLNFKCLSYNNNTYMRDTWYLLVLFFNTNELWWMQCCQDISNISSVCIVKKLIFPFLPKLLNLFSNYLNNR